MSKKVTIELFRAGKQTDGAGITREWTEADLDKIIEATNKKIDDVPAVIGHPKENSPAFAWFMPEKLFREGKQLFGIMGDITKEFGDALRRKNFKHRSISLRNDFSLAHVGFFGGKPVAVKGMAAFNFKEGEELQEFSFEFGEHDFSEHQIMTLINMIGGMFQNFRDKMLEKDGIEKTDSVISQFKIDALKRAESNTGHLNENNRFKEPNILKNPGQKPDNGGNTNMDYEKLFKEEQDKNSAITTELDSVKKESKDFSEKLIASEAKVTTLETEKETSVTKAKNKGYEEYAEKLVTDEKILPAHKNTVIAMQKTLDGQEAIDFAEGDKTVKKTPLEIYRADLEKKDLGGLYNEGFGETATPAESQNGEISAKVKEYEEKYDLSFGEASKKLRVDEPGLFTKLSFSEPQKDD